MSLVLIHVFIKKMPKVACKTVISSKIMFNYSTFTMKGRNYASLGIVILSVLGNVTERNSSSENTSPRKCERIVFADACTSKEIRKGKVM